MVPAAHWYTSAPLGVEAGETVLGTFAPVASGFAHLVRFEASENRVDPNDPNPAATLLLRRKDGALLVSAPFLGSHDLSWGFHNLGELLISNNSPVVVAVQCTGRTQISFMLFSNGELHKISE